MATGRPIPYRLSAMNPNRSIAFFDSQFQQQLREQAIEADLREARYDDKTHWPDGFNHVAAGAVLVTESNEAKP